MGGHHPTKQLHTALQKEKIMIAQKQADHLRRLQAAWENAKDFTEGCIRQERLDSYMEHLMKQGIDSQEITDLLY